MHIQLIYNEFVFQKYLNFINLIRKTYFFQSFLKNLIFFGKIFHGILQSWTIYYTVLVKSLIKAYIISLNIKKLEKKFGNLAINLPNH